MFGAGWKLGPPQREVFRVLPQYCPATHPGKGKSREIGGAQEELGSFQR